MYYRVSLNLPGNLHEATIALNRLAPDARLAASMTTGYNSVVVLEFKVHPKGACSVCHVPLDSNRRCLNERFYGEHRRNSDDG